MAEEKNGLERIVGKLNPEHVRTLAELVYAMDKPLLLLDSAYHLFFVSEQAEKLLGYSRGQIVLDTKKFQTEKKQSFDESAREFFANGVYTFNLKNVAYQSTDRKFNIVMDLHVERLHGGSIGVTFKRVDKYAAAREPAWYQYRYGRAVGDRHITVRGYIDNRNDKRFLEDVDAAYVSIRGTANKLVIDLSHAKDIVPHIMTLLAAKAREPNVLFVNPREESLYQGLLEKGVPPAQIQRHEPEGGMAPKPA